MSVEGSARRVGVRQGAGCDIGAYEYGGSGGSGGSTPAQLQPTHVVSDQDTVAHNEQMIDEHGYDVDTEYGLQTISISPLPLGNCGAIGNMTVCAMELLEAVDVSGHAAQGIDFCFSQQGQVYFLPSHDANGVAINQQTAQPERLPVWLSDGKTCVTINRNGKLFLVQALMSALLQVAPPATSTPDLFAGMSTTADGYKVGTQHGMQTIAVAPLPIDNCGAIGNMAVCAMNILDAADVSGFAQQGIRFCFPQVGQILFLPSHDGNGMPIDQQAAQPETLTVELINGHTCVEINRTGKLILVQSDSPLQLQTAPQTVVIQDCDLAPQLVVGGWAIRSGNTDLNLRGEASMAGSRVGVIRQGDIVRVLEGPVTANSYNWFRVETGSGDSGWAAESKCDYWLSPHDGPTATPSATLTSTPPANWVNFNTQGNCALADAIRAANTDSEVGDCSAGSGRDTIWMLQDITLSQALPRITSDIQVNGLSYTISGGGVRRIFDIDGGSLAVTQLQLINGRADDGGAVRVEDGTFISTSSRFDGNSATQDGGAIEADESNIRIVDSTFSNNLAADDGGAIYLQSGRGGLTVRTSTFNNNSSNDDGGAIASRDDVDVADSTFSRNMANGDGGAIYVTNDDMDVESTTLANNTADRGGAIYFYSDDEDEDAELIDNTFRSNQAEDDGGAYYHRSGVVAIERNTFRNNDADDNGGAIYAYSGQGTLSNNGFSGNRPENCRIGSRAEFSGDCAGQALAPQVVEVATTAAPSATP